MRLATTLFGDKMSLKKIINILDKFLTGFDKVREYVKKKYRSYKARRIRNAIDKHDTGTVAKRVRSILKKRKERSDSS